MRPRTPSSSFVPVAILLGALGACGGETRPAQMPAPAAAPGPGSASSGSAAGPSLPGSDVSQRTEGRFERDAFNHAAFAIGEPIFWERDDNGNGAPDPSEIRPLLFHPEKATGPSLASRIEKVRLAASAKRALGPREQLIAQENDQIRPVLVRSDLRTLPAAERAMVKHVLEATEAVDRLHARQKGLHAFDAQLAALDPESRAMFRRNWGPRCAAPRTEDNPQCTAIAGTARVPVDLYPAALQADSDFCARLERHPQAKSLLDPFVVVREKDGKLVPVPYTSAITALPSGFLASGFLADGKTSPWADDMNAAAKALDLAAVDLAGTKEVALGNYLKAAAKAFRDNRWFDADEAWSKMSANNSRYYLRIAPDETYWEPCARKAGFHVSFARVSEASQAWQQKLEPVKQDMEEALARTVAGVYAARKVTFHLPEFIDVMWNGGDGRDAVGATIGQSLPNWGPVAAGGRGRTVAMANLYADEDSRASRKRAARSLLCDSLMPYYGETHEPGLVATILHEATHNLGPSQEYRYKGKTDEQWFGGGLASTMEELKAQTGAFFFLGLLKARGVIDEKLERSSALDSVVWGFGHVSRGMVSPTGQRKPYGQLAAIQLGMLMDDGALVFDESRKAANGTDVGCFAMEWAKFPSAAQRMMAEIASLKATGDKRGAEALAGRYVDAANRHAVMRERMLREPRLSFVYSVDLE